MAITFVEHFKRALRLLRKVFYVFSKNAQNNGYTVFSGSVDLATFAFDIAYMLANSHANAKYKTKTKLVKKKKNHKIINIKCNEITYIIVRQRVKGISGVFGNFIKL